MTSFTATSRSSTVSWARQTVPMPPAPSRSSSRYRPATVLLHGLHGTAVPTGAPRHRPALRLRSHGACVRVRLRRSRPVYGAGDLAAGPARRGSASRASSRSPAASTPRCTPAGPGRCGSTPASAPPRSPTSATGTCVAQGTGGLSRRLRPADADGLRLRRPGGARRGRQGRRRDRLARGHAGRCSTGSRSTRCRRR